MASNQVMKITLAIAVILLPTIAIAKEFVVGDSSGWTNDFDYQDWAKDKVFRVGDKLVFNYPVGKHNVFKVNGTAFKDCTIPPANDALTSGKDEIVLATSGNKWYICGVAKHCANGGQKLAITVVDKDESKSSAVRNTILMFHGQHVFMAAIVVILAIAV